MPGEGNCFLADAFHQIAVRGEHVGVMIDDVAAEFGSHTAFRECHADGGGDALTERPRGGLDSRRHEIFRMTWRD